MYTVTFTKRFVSGNLIGLTHRTDLEFPNAESAWEYYDFLTSHSKIPISSIDSSDYVIVYANWNRI